MRTFDDLNGIGQEYWTILTIRVLSIRFYQIHIGATSGCSSNWNFSFGERINLAKKLYVGNLSFQATEEQVTDLFTEYGAVESMAWITDRDSGRFRGFCFIEMEESAANAAMSALNGKDIDGRDLRVNEAKPREERGGGGRRGGGGGRRSNYPDSGGSRW